MVTVKLKPKCKHIPTNEKAKFKLQKLCIWAIPSHNVFWMSHRTTWWRWELLPTGEKNGHSASFIGTISSVAVPHSSWICGEILLLLEKAPTLKQDSSLLRKTNTHASLGAYVCAEHSLHRERPRNVTLFSVKHLLLFTICKFVLGQLSLLKLDVSWRKIKRHCWIVIDPKIIVLKFSGK